MLSLLVTSLLLFGFPGVSASRIRKVPAERSSRTKVSEGVRASLPLLIGTIKGSEWILRIEDEIFRQVEMELDSSQKTWGESLKFASGQFDRAKSDVLSHLKSSVEEVLKNLKSVSSVSGPGIRYQSELVTYIRSRLKEWGSHRRFGLTLYKYTWKLMRFASLILDTLKPRPETESDVSAYINFTSFARDVTDENAFYWLVEEIDAWTEGIGSRRLTPDTTQSYFLDATSRLSNLRGISTEGKEQVTKVLVVMREGPMR